MEGEMRRVVRGGRMMIMEENLKVKRRIRMMIQGTLME